MNLTFWCIEAASWKAKSISKNIERPNKCVSRIIACWALPFPFQGCLGF